jgi:hypothetical protein
MEETKEAPSLAQKLNHCKDAEHCFVDATFKFMTYCNVCTGLCWGLSNQGKRCLFCRFICHEKCQQDALHSFPCKSHEQKFATNTKHHWVKGNLIGLTSICAACDATLVLPAAPVALGKYYRCSYCCRKIHEDCMGQFTDVCDGGAFANNLILPHELSFNDEVQKPILTFDIGDSKNPKQKSPVLVFFNSRSGAGQGEAVLQAFCSYLNKYQLYDLADGGPKKGLERFKGLCDFRFCFLSFFWTNF